MEISRQELDNLLALHAELCRRQMDVERYHTDGDKEALQRTNMRFSGLYANLTRKPELKAAPCPNPNQPLSATSF